MEIDSQTKIVLEKIENLLKDRFNGYALVAMDGTDVFHICSSKIVAMGSAKYLENVIYGFWNEYEDD